MILNLETEKPVDSSKRLSVVSGYSQLRTTLGIPSLIGDLAFQPLHCLYTWGHRGMDKHRNIKIALGEFYCDHRQMPTDGLLASCIRGLVALYLDSTAVSQKKEMMSCFLVTKTMPWSPREFTPANLSPLQGEDCWAIALKYAGPNKSRKKKLKTFIGGKARLLLCLSFMTGIIATFLLPSNTE
jgi:hypothetical protein